MASWGKKEDAKYKFHRGHTKDTPWNQELLWRYVAGGTRRVLCRLPLLLLRACVTYYAESGSAWSGEK